MAIVIADLCHNHSGNRLLLREMIAAAAEAGADYVNIPAMFADDLTRRERFEQGVTRRSGVRAIKRPYQTEYARLSTLEIPFELYDWFADECTHAGIKPLATVFTRARIEEAARYGWEAVRVASYDCGSLPLLRDLKAHFKHLFVLTGAAYDDEIAAAADLLTDTSFSLLHCVMLDPTPLDQAHLARLAWLRQFTPSVGLSDHSLASRDDIKVSAVALMLGADVIERPFTILDTDQTPDGALSITPPMLRALTMLAHGSEALRRAYVEEFVGDYSALLGQVERELSQEELLNRDYHRGRFASHLPDGRVLYNWEDEAVT